MRKKTGGPRKNSNVKIEVSDINDNVRLIVADCENQHEFAPLQVRVLDAGEYVTSDFQETKTLSEIVRELGGITTDLNDVPLESVLKACMMFSSHGHSVTADPPVPIEQAVLHAVTVDVDSVTAVFKHRNVGMKQNIESILKKLTDTLGDGWTGFNTCTSYWANDDWIKALPSNMKGGPTMEMYEKGDRYRVHLPTPPGFEILQIWIYSPPKLDHSVFLKNVKQMAQECALELLQQYNQSRLYAAFIDTKESKLQGGKACPVPGGYKLALGIALLFLEQHNGGTMVLETYNCKQKIYDSRCPPKILEETNG